MEHGPKSLEQLAQFLFEAGTLRKIPRMHCQVLLTSDLSDNIASHSFRVTLIGYFLAKLERVNAAKVMLMCLSHDVPETRTGDHNWVHRHYVRENELGVVEEQLGPLGDSELLGVAREYLERETPESLVAKDADVLDQILLLHEYALQGNEEAKRWLRGKTEDRDYNYTKYLKTQSGIALGRALYEVGPTDWWMNIHQANKRTS